MTVALEAIKAFEKVKNNSHSLVDKKILDFLDEYRVELSNNENKINFKEIGNNKTSSVAEISLKAASSKKWTCFFYELSKIKKFHKIQNHIFNIGGEKTININSLVKKLEIFIGLKAKKRNVPKISLDPDFSLANSKKIKKFINKSFKHNLDDGLKETVKWMKTYI